MAYHFSLETPLIVLSNIQNFLIFISLIFKNLSIDFEIPNLNLEDFDNKNYFLFFIIFEFSSFKMEILRKILLILRVRVVGEFFTFFLMSSLNWRNFRLNIHFWDFLEFLWKTNLVNFVNQRLNNKKNRGGLPGFWIESGWL